MERMRYYALWAIILWYDIMYVFGATSNDYCLPLKASFKRHAMPSMKTMYGTDTERW